MVAAQSPHPRVGRRKPRSAAWRAACLLSSPVLLLPFEEHLPRGFCRSASSRPANLAPSSTRQVAPGRWLSSRSRKSRVSTERHAVLPAVAGRTTGIAVSSLALLCLGVQRVRQWLHTPSRPYSAEANTNSVRAEYDMWTREGVLEHYWGEHIHMGSYTPLGKQSGYDRDDSVVAAFLRASVGGHMKNFKDAKLDFSIEMLEWSGAKQPRRILDVGCGIGGSSRYLAKTFPDAEVLGITLSPEQVARATELAKSVGLDNCKFQVTNALDTKFADGSFDLVWACESGEHMPDKKKYVEEMARVLAPGGNLVVATWCQRDPDPPFTEEEKTALQYVYDEWSHPYFISIKDYAKLMEDTKMLDSIETDDWTERTLPSWRHSIWVGVWSPWFWIKVMLKKPKAFLGFLRDAYCLERFHRDMRRGLLTYGMMKAVKPKAGKSR